MEEFVVYLYYALLVVITVVVIVLTFRSREQYKKAKREALEAKILLLNEQARIAYYRSITDSMAKMDHKKLVKAMELFREIGRASCRERVCQYV